MTKVRLSNGQLDEVRYWVTGFDTTVQRTLNRHTSTELDLPSGYFCASAFDTASEDAVGSVCYKGTDTLGVSVVIVQGNDGALFLAAENFIIDNG